MSALQLDYWFWVFFLAVLALVAFFYNYYFSG